MTREANYDATVTGALEEGATAVPPRVPNGRGDAVLEGSQPISTDLGGAEYASLELGTTPPGFTANERAANGSEWLASQSGGNRAWDTEHAGAERQFASRSELASTGAEDVEVDAAAPTTKHGGSAADLIAIAGGVAVGAALMYFLDPDRGRRRRAMVKDRVSHLASVVPDIAGTTGRDLANRSRGLVAQARGRFASDDRNDDETIVARVRSRMGRAVSHPGSVAVTCNDGRVTVSGPILASEVDELMRIVSGTRGVTEVLSQLEVHEESKSIDVPGLQGGRERSGPRFELMQENWTPAARLLTSVAGGTLAAWAGRRRDLLGTAVGLFGLGLAVRGATNKPVLTPLVSRAKKTAQQLPSQLGDAAADLPEKAKELASDAVGQVKERASGLVDQARDLAGGMGDARIG